MERIEAETEFFIFTLISQFRRPRVLNLFQSCILLLRRILETKLRLISIIICHDNRFEPHLKNV